VGGENTVVLDNEQRRFSHALAMDSILLFFAGKAEGYAGAFFWSML
jgi:hypothetical protein